MKKADFNAIGTRFNIDPVVARVLRNRDLIEEKDIEMFLYGNLSMTHDPLLMKDMDKGTDIIIDRIRGGSSIRIIGDYDVDGVMSTYILYDGLKKLGADVSYDIPHRMTDGYGLNERLIRKAHEDGIDTIITCDNGIAANAAIQLAKDYGMTVVVTDHHEPQDEKVPADAVIDIKQADDNYPYKEICGATVAYKFIKCIYDKTGLELPADRYIDCVGIATNCDVMTLLDESRIYVKEALRVLKTTENVGLRALLRVLELSGGKELNTYHLGFLVGPCINAAGRLDSALKGMDLLTSTNIEEATRIAEELKELNESRKSMTDTGVQRALEIIEEENLNRFNILVVYVPGLHESLAGIAAGRIKERFYKPAIVFTDSENPDALKGSGRSIEGYNLFKGLKESEDFLIKFGGHELAAGLGVRRDMLDAFREDINAKENMSEDVLTEKLLIDVPMPMSYVTIDLIRQLSALGPFGKGNESPVFAQSGGLKVKSARRSKNNDFTIWLVFEDAEGRTFESVYFKANEFINDINEWFTEAECDKMLNGQPNAVRLDVAYSPEINEFRGEVKIQYRPLHYRKHED